MGAGWVRQAYCLPMAPSSQACVQQNLCTDRKYFFQKEPKEQKSLPEPLDKCSTAPPFFHLMALPQPLSYWLPDNPHPA